MISADLLSADLLIADVLGCLLSLAIGGAVYACGCADLDGPAAVARARASRYLLDECAEGHPCEAAQVRALERAQLCSAAAEAARHGLDAGTGGVECRP